MTLSSIHHSVLLHECFDLLNISASQRHIDATLGMGGHALYFLQQNALLECIGFDQDAQAREIAAERLSPFAKRITLRPYNFEKIAEEAWFQPTSILFDIGVSSLHLDTPIRGFSFRFDAPLDMRMNRESGETAADIINTRSEAELSDILWKYGEEKHARRIAAAIVCQRNISPIQTTTQLCDVVCKSVPAFIYRKKNAGGHPASLTFQAIRIVVNRELEVLESALHSAIKMLVSGGRLGVISFHSLEDRIVKQIFAQYTDKEKRQKYGEKSLVSSGIVRQITKKPCIPSDSEILHNPRSRSAKLRVIEKI